MRALAILMTLLSGFGLWPMAWAADCNIGGRDGACGTENGYYRIRLPDGPGPHPAVIYLYGSLGNSARLLAYDGFVQAFIERGYAVIVPIALDMQYRGDAGVGSGWYTRHERGRKKRDDAAFMEEVLIDAAARHRIDRRKVLMAGMSRGGVLAWEIACHNPTLVQAYAPIAAGYLGKMPSRCSGPVHLLHTHGRGDTIVRLPPARRFTSAGAVMQPLSDSLDRIARTGGCVAAGREAKFREYVRTDWDGCPGNASVSLLLHNGGHDIPLSWYSTVVDWFEGIVGPTRQQTTPQVSAGTPRFKGVGSGTGFKGAGTQTGFKGTGNRSDSRFKKAKVPSQ